MCARFCLCPPRLESLFPPVLWKLQSNPAGLQSQIPWEFSGPLLNPQAGKPDVGFRTFTTVGELLWYYCSPVCRSPTQRVWDFILSGLCSSYNLTVAYSLSLNGRYLFLVGSSVLLLKGVQSVQLSHSIVFHSLQPHGL